MRGSRSARFRFFFVAACLVTLATASLYARAQNAAPPATAATVPSQTWPRQATVDGTGVTVYQPQVESWTKNQLTARAAVALQEKASPTPIFGVVWLAARTEVDKETHLVSLEDIKVSKVNFPSQPGQAASYQTLLAKALPTHSKTVSLDRLQASLAVSQAESATKKLPLKNDPPRIIYSNQSAILVLIDGKPVLRKVDGSRFLRVINTRALIMFDPTSALYYLYFMDRWLQASNLESTWSASAPPDELDAIKTTLAEQHIVDLLDDPSPELKLELEEGIMPVLYVSTAPAELIQTKGALQFASIDGTQLLWVTNTDDDILYDTAGQNYYAAHFRALVSQQGADRPVAIRGRGPATAGLCQGAGKSSQGRHIGVGCSYASGATGNYRQQYPANGDDQAKRHHCLARLRWSAQLRTHCRNPAAVRSKFGHPGDPGGSQFLLRD